MGKGRDSEIARTPMSRVVGGTPIPDYCRDLQFECRHSTSVLSTLKLRVVSVVGNQSSLLQRELFCRSDLRIATFTRKISVDTPLVVWYNLTT